MMGQRWQAGNRNLGPGSDPLAGPGSFRLTRSDAKRDIGFER